MLYQTIPITLTPGVPPPDVKTVTAEQVLKLVADYMAASIRADITFIPIVTNDPASFDGQLIFNVAQNIFKSWSIASGAYSAVTENVIGDIKDTFIGNDDIARGWVILNGRAISSITGISAAQTTALETLFGAGGNLPTIAATHTNGLPAGNAFGDIVWPPSLAPVIQPAAGVISPGLAFSNPVADTEAQALANQTEVLRTSVQDSFDVTKQIQAVAQAMLTALNQSSTPPIYAAVFCGYS